MIMTQEEKQLLLKDLCARVPYRPFIELNPGSYNKPSVHRLTGVDESQVYLNIDSEPYNIEHIKLYLRPMSSMTEEEIEEYRNLSDEVIGSYGPYHHEFIAHCVRLGIKPDNPHECVDDFLNMEAIDWLIEHHFDYRRLIEKGLALEAPEGMYKLK